MDILIPRAIITFKMDSMRIPLEAFSILPRVTVETSQSIAAVFLSNFCCVRLAFMASPMSLRETLKL